MGLMSPQMFFFLLLKIAKKRNVLNMPRNLETPLNYYPRDTLIRTLSLKSPFFLFLKQ